MRILFVINSFTRAGAEKLVYDLSQAIRDRCEYVGVAALYRMGHETEADMQAQLNRQGIDTFVLDKRAGRDRADAVGKLVRIIRENRIDLIHGHCSVPMLLGKLAGLLTRVPVVCTIHNTRGYSARRERLTAWMTDAYVSIGRSAEEYMTAELGIPEERITRIYNAVDSRRFVPQPREPGFWQRHGVACNGPVILNIGRIVEAKNQICLLRAAERCVRDGVPVTVVILGDCETELYQSLRDYGAEHGLEGRVYFLGLQDRVWEFLNQADCFVMTSLYEGLSVAFLEAVLCGTPIIASDMPFVAELNEIAPCAAVIPQNDDKGLAALLERGSYERQSPETMEKFRRLFSMERFAGEHLALYRRVLENKRKKLRKK